MQRSRKLGVLVDVSIKILVVAVFLVAEGQRPHSPEILNHGIFLDTDDDDIAHFTCIARGVPRPSVSWEKAGVAMTDSVEGVAILSSSNNTVEESHLFIAVTGDHRRGEYVCVVSNVEGVAKQTFEVKGKPPKLSSVDYAAICISLVLTVLLTSVIGFLLRRRIQQIKREKKGLTRRPQLLEPERRLFLPKTDSNNERRTESESRTPTSRRVYVDIH